MRLESPEYRTGDGRCFRQWRKTACCEDDMEQIEEHSGTRSDGEIIGNTSSGLWVEFLYLLYRTSRKNQ